MSIRDNKDILIIILSVLLIMSILGMHFFHWFLEGVEQLIDRVIIIFKELMFGVSYNTGEAIHVTSDTISGMAKQTIDLGNGVFDDIGNLLKSGGNYVTPPVYVHNPIPSLSKVQQVVTRAPKKKHRKHPKKDEGDENDEHSDEDGEEGEEDEESHKESMETMLSPYTFTSSSGYSRWNQLPK